ncbi:MAG: protein kinase, partial [Chloroflexota bacterium]|nr:protein kinase [Chloroflexota bacterium]
HRDVKPSNVLMADDGRIYLADFGLARIAQAGESTLSTDMMLGTPQYISPEQAMGMSDLDEGTDIYSFGVMLYELTVGQVPFSADTPFSVIHDHIYSPLPLPSKINADIPEAIERVLLKALAKEREDRFDNVDLMVAAFAQALSDGESTMGAGAKIGADAATLPLVPFEGEEELSTVGNEEDLPAAGATPKAEVSAIPKQADQKEKKHPRRFRWWHIVITVIGLALCLIIFAWTANKIQNKIDIGKKSGPQTVEVSREQPEETTADISADVADGDIKEMLNAARQLVADNPDDPFAHLELAFTYFDTGDFDAGEGEIGRAFELAQDQPEVYLNAADQFVEREMWMDAAKIYLEVNKKFPEALSEEYMDGIHQSVYMMAAQPDAVTLLPDLAEIDPAMESVAKARNFYYGNSEEAQEVLDIALSEYPDFPEAQLLQIEILVDQGDQIAAQANLRDLKELGGLPEWIKMYIDSLGIDGEQVPFHDLGAIREDVNANPDDPWLRLKLVEAMLEAGEFEGVRLEIQRALELAGDDVAVYHQAAEILERYNLWLHAASVYVAGVKASGHPPATEIREKIAQAVYLGADAPDAINVLEESNIADTAAPLLMELARIRYTLHNEDREVAQDRMATLKEQNPDAPEVLLLEAEILYILGEEDAAMQQWNQLLVSEAAPVWVQDQATIFLDKFEQ